MGTMLEKYNTYCKKDEDITQRYQMDLENIGVDRYSKEASVLWNNKYKSEYTTLINSYSVAERDAFILLSKETELASHENVKSFTNNRGVEFNVKFEPNNGDDKLGSKVEFFDKQRKDFSTLGQRIGRYYVSTILDIKEGAGLNLHGGIPEWSIDGETMNAIKEWVDFLNKKNVLLSKEHNRSSILDTNRVYRVDLDEVIMMSLSGTDVESITEDGWKLYRGEYGAGNMEPVKSLSENEALEYIVQKYQNACDLQNYDYEINYVYDISTHDEVDHMVSFLNSQMQKIESPKTDLFAPKDSTNESSCSLKIK
jgi:hypothetical protein